MHKAIYMRSELSKAHDKLIAMLDHVSEEAKLAHIGGLYGLDDAMRQAHRARGAMVAWQVACGVATKAEEGKWKAAQADKELASALHLRAVEIAALEEAGTLEGFHSAGVR